MHHRSLGNQRTEISGELNISEKLRRDILHTTLMTLLKQQIVEVFHPYLVTDKTSTFVFVILNCITGIKKWPILTKDTISK